MNRYLVVLFIMTFVFSSPLGFAETKEVVGNVVDVSLEKGTITLDTQDGRITLGVEEGVVEEGILEPGDQIVAQVKEDADGAVMVDYDYNIDELEETLSPEEQ